MFLCIRFHKMISKSSLYLKIFHNPSTVFLFPEKRKEKKIKSYDKLTAMFNHSVI